MKLVDSSADQWVVMLLVAKLEESLVFLLKVDSSVLSVVKLFDSSDQWVAKLEKMLVYQ